MAKRLYAAKSYLSFAAKKVESDLDQALALFEPKLLYEAMRYAVLGGGKRLRAALVYLGAYGREDLARKAACAVEMVHAYSLIHDDLPCMDDDDYRRGKPSCHKVFGEAVAVLAGDALLTKAFEMLSLLENNTAQAVRELSASAGAKGMVGGQIMDLEAENASISIGRLREIHSQKTGALISASLKLGALAADKADFLVQYSAYGNKLGMAFQITDDILDATGDKKTLGKIPGSDIKAGKTTYVSFFGIEKAMELAKNAIIEAKEAAKGLPGEEILCGIADFVITREN